MKNQVNESTYTLLYSYCDAGMYDRVNKLLQKYNDVDITYKNGVCFDAAIRQGDVGILQTLLDYANRTKTEPIQQYQLRKILLDAYNTLNMSEEIHIVLDPYVLTKEMLCKKGDEYTKQKEYDVAENYYYKAIEISHGTYKVAYLHLGNMFADHSKNEYDQQKYEHATQLYVQAVHKYKYAIALDQKYAYAYAQLGDTYSQMLGIQKISHTAQQNVDYYKLAYDAYQAAKAQKAGFYLHANIGLLSLMVIAEKYDDVQRVFDILQQENNLSTYAYNALNKIILTAESYKNQKVSIKTTFADHEIYDDTDNDSDNSDTGDDYLPMPSFDNYQSAIEAANIGDIAKLKLLYENHYEELRQYNYHVLRAAKYGDKDQSIQCLLDCNPCNKTKAILLCQLGDLYTQDQNFLKARVCYEDAIKSDNKYYIGYLHLANCFFEMGKTNESTKVEYLHQAEEYYNKILEYKENYSYAYKKLGILHQALGEDVQAIKDYIKAINYKKPQVSYKALYDNVSILLENNALDSSKEIKSILDEFKDIKDKDLKLIFDNINHKIDDYKPEDKNLIVKDYDQHDVLHIHHDSGHLSTQDTDHESIDSDLMGKNYDEEF